MAGKPTESEDFLHQSIDKILKEGQKKSFQISSTQNLNGKL